MNSDLNLALISIGMRLGLKGRVASKGRFDLERVLLEASGKMRDDGRLASLMFSWISIHAEHVIVEKLRKLMRKNNDEDQLVAVSALAVYAVNHGQHKWKKLIHPLDNKSLFKSKSAKSAVKLKGEEQGFSDYGILLAKGSLRIRQEDILTVEDLAKANLQYRNRLLFGASWRADIITAIQQGAKTATEIQKRIGCSYEPAHRIRREYLIASGL